jgi:predicted SnoaL-like aldol condensation-catalyzing enzyme
MSTVEQNKMALHKIFEAINSGNQEMMQETFKEVISPNYRLHNPTFKKSPITFAEWWDTFETFIKDHLNYKITFYEILGEGDKTATHGTTEWIEAASKEKYQGEIFFFSRYEDGKIVEEWELFHQKPLIKVD